ncbi:MULTISPECIES: PilN domain-containing protein [Idiomarina]|jgi:Tfp pilus assembly protein PilN|uniref:PilN domain-containing protein n=1 Tax=Idiomarina TaxID=135575 RepID=UPI000C5E1BB2|nr:MULTISPECIES: PilN domain-containing protein [Idiomarina]MAO68720.1 Type II secretory pathway component [Idiomarina sp.]MBF81129.1 Type II secretory pathway component [Idiomarina sp.]|tara:strand:+ start:1072 stop:1668 length:597 start_codon:yes stop_codon:yes gene_type:complete
MKQWVNLYRRDLQPIKQRLTLARLSAVLGVWLALLIAVVVVTQWQNSAVTHENEKLSNALQAVNDDLTRARERLERREPSLQLREEKEELIQQLQDTQSFSRRISEFQQGQSSSVSRFLSELAQITPEAIWLTDFSIAGEDIRLHGQALNSEALVLWMDKFGQSDLLADKRFAVVELKRSEQGYQQFLLQSVRTDEDK